ncbi:MAG: dodecin domain-containing protein [Ardenticatenales bacterium]|nr:dodecin domain-containing protein [Ardenticatenales bacterium]
MSVAKVIELIAESPTSWEDAAQNAVNAANKTLRHVRSVYIKDMQAVVENGKITQFRLNCNVTFVVDPEL